MKVYIRGQLAGTGTTTGTIFHLKRNDGAATVPGDIDNVAQAFALSTTSNPISKYAASLSSSWHWTVVTVTDLGGTGYQNQESVSQVGSVTGTYYPPQCSICVSWHASGINWRGGRPRNYLPAVPTSASSTPNIAQITPTFAAAVVTQSQAFQTAVETIALTGSATPQLGLVSYKHLGALRPTPVFFHYIGVNCHQRLDSQRRRSGKESSYGIS